MHRGIAILLAIAFSWMLVLPLFASSTTQSNLPLCCRKGGKHKCLSAAAHSEHSESSTATIRDKCPRFARTFSVSNRQVVTAAYACYSFAGLLQHPTGLFQTEAGYRISFHRSRQKRGPPAFLLS